MKQQAIESFSGMLAEQYSRINVGEFLFNEVSKNQKDIFELGTTIRQNSNPHSSNGGFDKLQKLNKQIEKITLDVKSNFAQSENMIADQDYFLRVARPTSTLLRYMEDCLNSPAPQAVENFQDAYKEHLELVNSVIAQLEKKSTNPLVQAMNADPLKTRNTFNKWYDIINGVLGQVMFLEIFASGLVQGNTSQKTNQLVERSIKLLETIRSWEDEYKNDSSYWYNLKSYLEQFQETNLEFSSAKKADKLQVALDDVLTNDSFYLMVYDSLKENAFYEFNVSVDEQLIESHNNNGCSIVIYRSKQANSAEPSHLERLQSEVDILKKSIAAGTNEVPNAEHFESFIYKEHLKNQFGSTIQNAGYICVFAGVKAEIRSSNFSRRNVGPGFFEMTKTENDEFSSGVIVGYL